MLTNTTHTHRQTDRQTVSWYALDIGGAVVTVHCSLSAVTHAPFLASVLRPASQVGPMHEAAGIGEVS